MQPLLVYSVYSTIDLMSTCISTCRYFPRLDKNTLKLHYDTTIEQVNQRVTEKANIQINLNETRDTVRETNQHVSMTWSYMNSIVLYCLSYRYCI
jgi:hypothetical protein